MITAALAAHARDVWAMPRSKGTVRCVGACHRAFSLIPDEIVYLAIEGGGREETSIGVDLRLPTCALCVGAICQLPLGSWHTTAEAYTSCPPMLMV